MSAVLLTIKPGVTIGPGTSVKVPVAPPTYYTLTVNITGNGLGIITSSPAGISSGNLTAMFASGNVVTLSANAAMGSNFVGWSGGGASGTGTATVTIDGDKTVTATFSSNATLVNITVTPTTPSVVMGSTIQLTATGTYSNGSDSDITNQVTWSSLDEAVATIDTNGLALGVAPGSSTIFANLNSITGTRTLTVTDGAPGLDRPLTGVWHNSPEEEIVNQETILSYYETLAPSDRQALVAALRADEIAVQARERAERTARNKALGVHTGKTIDEYSTSAWQIKQDYPDSEDGVYWIQNDSINNGDPFQVYCDMTTLGGGWTLIVQNSACEWQTNQVFLHNETNAPTQLVGYDVQSTDYNYSILSWADKIKRSESGFDFMITAREHGSLGGAWTANESYSFVQTLENVDLGDEYLGTTGWRKNITELARFGYQDRMWNYGTESMEARMPWVGIGINCGWLTTDGFRGGWWGTLIAESGWYPAPWLSDIENGAHPGAIWYWVR